MKSNRSTGFWWLPNNPQSKIYGHLNYRFGYYPSLSLHGTFDENIGAQYHQIVLGQVDNCKITLLNCARILLNRTQSGSGDFVKSKYQAVVILKGHHLEKIEDLRFSKIEVNYSHLREWIGHHIIEYPNHQNNSNETILTLKKPKQIEIRLIDLTIEIRGTYENHFGSFKQIAEQDVIASFFSMNMDFIRVLELIQNFRNFLQLLTDEEIEINGIIANGIQRFEIIMPTIMKGKNLNDRFKFCPVPVEANSILPKIDFYFKNWFIFAEKYEPVYELYFGELYRRTYVTNRFLNYCQALEAYHSRNERFDNKFFKGDCAKIIAKLMAIINATDLKPYKETIRTKLGFLTRKTLRMIVEELIQNNKESVSNFISNSESFACKVVETRNYYTHYSSKNKLAVGELIKLAEDLRFLLVAIMLKEIGFEQALTNITIGLYCRDRVTAIYGLNGIYRE